MSRASMLRDWRHRTGRAKPMADYLAEIEPEHGTESRYTSTRFKCRCDECRKAANAAKRERRASGEVHTHNAAGYSNGCRCSICTAAHAQRTRERRSKARADA